MKQYNWTQCGYRLVNGQMEWFEEEIKTPSSMAGEAQKKEAERFQRMLEDVCKRLSEMPISQKSALRSGTMMDMGAQR